jgi:hypothetical protein
MVDIANKYLTLQAALVWSKIKEESTPQTSENISAAILKNFMTQMKNLKKWK